MPNATITSTASTFGTISGTFAADQSTITGTISGVITGTLDGSVGVPGPQGSPGVGVPAGGLTAQFLQKTSGLDYATDWVTLPAYLPLAGGTMDVNATIELSDTFTGTVSEVGGYGMAVSSDSNNNLLSNFLYDRIFVKNATSQTTLKPTGVEFPDATLQTTAFTGWNNVALTGNPTAPTAGLADNDTSIATTAFVQQELASGTANARNLEVYVRNQTGSTLAAGTIAYINGATGNRPTVTPAQANNDANSAQTFGFVKTSIANNGFGFVIVRGEVENLDTSALTEGVQLYLSPTTAGAYTTTKPSAPQHLVYVGIVVRAHPTQGVILAAIQNGYELNEIHDVAISSITDGDLLSYESATTLWKNKSISTLGLATQSWVTSQGYLTSASLTGYAQLSGATFTGKVVTPASTTSSAGLRITSGVAPTTPLSGDFWFDGTNLKAGLGGGTTGTLPFLSTGNTWTGINNFGASTGSFAGGTAGGAISIGSGATTTGLTKTLNLGTSGAAGSTTNIAIGSTTGTSTTTLQGITNGTTQTAGDSSLKLATTAFVTTADNLKANLASPTFTGVPLSTTAAVDTNTTQIATTAFVVGQGYLKTSAAASTYAPLASPSLTGVPLSTTAAADTNTTQIATTAYVVGQASTTTPAATGTAAVGTSLKYARADHVHANPLPTGGTANQVLSKVDGTSYNVAWTTVASGGGTWGSITGTLSSQTDLQSALDAKLSTATAASTYAPFASPTFTGTVTIPAGASISGYLTTATASSTYQTLAGMSSYLTTATAASTYAPLASPTFTGTVTIPAGASISGYLTASSASSTYQTLAGMSSYLTTATAATTYAPLASPALTGTPTAPTALTADSSTTIATTAFVKAQGYLTSAPVTSVAGRTGAVTLSNTDISGLGTMATATAADYSTTTVANGLYYPLTGNPSGFLTSASLSGYAPLASPTFTGTVTIPAGASISGYATTASLASYAPLASPSLTGVPVSTTAAADTNTTQIATTAFVVGQASSTTPANNGTAAVGTSLKYARADHAHATDTTRAPLASPTFSGTPSLPTGTTAVTQTALDSSTKLATTAFVRADNNVKAWVNFNGTGTVAIRASFNVSSITDSAVGTYVVNLTTAISDTSYAVLGTSLDPGVNYGLMSAGVNSTTAVTVGTFKTTAPNTAADNAQNYVAVLR